MVSPLDLAERLRAYREDGKNVSATLRVCRRVVKRLVCLSSREERTPVLRFARPVRDCRADPLDPHVSQEVRDGR